MSNNNAKPDFDLCVLDKETESKGKIGAGWKNQDGRIGIKLNVGVTISWKDNLVIGLFPAKDWSRQNPQPPSQNPPRSRIDQDDNMPF